MIASPPVEQPSSNGLLIKEGRATVHSLPPRDAQTSEPWLAIVDNRPCRREFLFNFLRDRADMPKRMLGLSVQELLRDHDEAQAPSLIVFSVGGLSITDPRLSGDFERLLAGFAAVPIVVLSDLDASDEAQLALAAGAKGFVSTVLDPHLMCLALVLVQAGGIFAPPSLMSEWVRARHSAGNDAADEGGAKPVPQYEELTPRQTHVLHLLQEGHANKVIATKLGMTESTVKVHVRQIMRRLGANNRTEAALLAQRHQDALRRKAC